MENKCTIPPVGWECSRTPGHDGPCAASPIEVTVPPLMAMRVLTAGLHEGKRVVTGITRPSDSRPTINAHGTLFEVDDENVRGYLPSRVWYDVNAQVFRLSYYTSETLHPNVRPFKDQNTYILIIKPYVDDVIHYPIEWRLFVEQIVCCDAPMGIAYVFLFGEQLYDQILIDLREQ